MNIFDNIKFPLDRVSPEHEIIKKTIFIKGENPPAGVIPALVDPIFLDIADLVLVLQESIGFNNSWNKVKIKNSNGKFEIIGFVNKNDIKTVNSAVKPSVKSSNDTANSNELAIDWREQSANVPYLDKNKGNYSVHYDTGVQSVNNNLQEIMKEALISGLSLILKRENKRFDKEYVEFLQNKYYLFGQVEAISFAIRNCSTLRALVTLPTRYLNSDEIETSIIEESADINTSGLIAKKIDLTDINQVSLPGPKPVVEKQSKDLIKCVVDNADLARRSFYKTATYIAKLEELRNKEIQNQDKREGGVLSDLKNTAYSASLDATKVAVNSRSYKAVEKIFNPDWPTEWDKLPSPQGQLKVFNEWYLPALKELDIDRILAELLKCSTRFLSPSDLAALLAKYKNAKNYLDEAAFATVCNPVLTKKLKIFDGFSFPEIPIYNPNGSLAKVLTEAYIRIVTDILVLGIRKLLTSSVQACLQPDFKSPGSGPAPTGNFIDGLNTALDNNDETVNDLIDSLFQIGDLDPEKQRQERLAARSKFNSLFEDLACLLSTKDLCNLLQGNPVSREIFDLSLSIIKNKYPSLLASLPDRSSIESMFRKIGSSVDLKICDEINSPTSIIPSNLRCDDGQLQSARERILGDKGLDPDVVDAILSDIKNQEKQNVEDILKFLDSDQPFNFSKVPSILCKKGPNGEILPPDISLESPIESFKSTLNVLLKDTYESFNREAVAWKTNNFSIEQKASPMVKFDPETGKIELLPLKDPKTEPPTADTSKKVLPAYLFNEIINKKEYKIVSDLDFSYKVDILGNKQQELDANLISNDLRNRVFSAEITLRNFLEQLKAHILSYFLTNSIFLSAEASIILKGDWNSIGTLLLQNISDANMRRVAANLTIFDNFLDSSNKVSKAFEAQDTSNSLLLADQSVPVYNKIMEIITAQKGDFVGLIALLTRNELRGIALESEIEDPFIRQKYNSLNLGSTAQGALQDSFNSCLKEYEIVKNSYKIIQSSVIKYPEYSIDYRDNLDPIEIDNTALYNAYSFNVNKNKNSYINIKNQEKLDVQVTNKIKTLMGSNQTKFSRKDVFKKYMEPLNPEITNLEDYYEPLTKQFFDSITNNVKKSSFVKVTNVKKEAIEYRNKSGDLVTKDEWEAITDPEKTVMKTDAVDTAITDYLQLVLEGRPTPQEKACGVYPHFLDIDSVKNDAVKNKQESTCAEISADARTPVEADSLETMETNSTQNIMLSTAHLLYLRTSISEIILRGVGALGIYDPQELSDDLVIDFITNLIEIETRSVDARYFNLLMDFLTKQFKALNPNVQFSDSILFKKQILKNVVREELTKHVLPKLAKRILKDTNKKLVQEGLEEIKFLDIYGDIKYFEVKDGQNIVFNFHQTMRKPSETRIVINFVSRESTTLNGELHIFSGTWNQFKISEDFKVLFEYLFPIKRYLSLLYITNVLCTSTRRQIIDTFKTTKKNLRKLALLIMTDGEQVVPSLNNPQDVLNEDEDDAFYWFILEALATTPLKIAKGYLETSDPNVALASTIYKVAKAFEPEVSSVMIPALGALTGIPGFIGANFPFFAPMLIPMAPFSYNPPNIAYYALGLWYEDNSSGINKQNEAKRTYLGQLINTIVPIEKCVVGAKHDDIVVLNDQNRFIKE